MPKQKTKKSITRRFKVTKKGKLLRRQGFRRHLNVKKRSTSSLDYALKCRGTGAGIKLQRFYFASQKEKCRTRQKNPRRACSRKTRGFNQNNNRSKMSIFTFTGFSFRLI